jgi:membrane protein YqaA with SNARE-associated domain
MSLKLSETPMQDFIEYNDPLKRLSLIISVSILAYTALLVVMNVIILKKPLLFEDFWFMMILTHIQQEAVSLSALGLFYISLFGGLFFLFFPIDPFFIAAIKLEKFSVLHALALFCGLFLSYAINYIIGMKLSGVSKNLISPKNFYKTKVAVNKFGSPAIFFINLIGFGSQQLSFVLGVLRYNKTRFIALAVAGQFIRVLIVAGLTLLAT